MRDRNNSINEEAEQLANELLKFLGGKIALCRTSDYAPYSILAEH